jgi:nucleoside-diphosphate-sugar epimerase
VVGPAETPADESSPIRPLHPYAASKAAAEALVHAYVNSYGLRAVILRPNFIVGAIPPPHPYRDNLIYDFVARVAQSGTLELIGDPGFQREWLHPSDIGRAVHLAVEADLPRCETFMLSANRCTMRELAERIVQRGGCGRVTVNPDGAGFTLISSSAKAHRQLGWEPRVTLDEIVAEIWEEYRARSAGRHKPHPMPAEGRHR